MKYPVSDGKLLERYSNILNNEALWKISNWVMPNNEKKFDEADYLQKGVDQKNIDIFAESALKAVKSIRSK